MREVFAKLGEDIRLGRRGENLATRVTFDVSGWMSSGDGTIHLLHQRNGDNVPYPCAITVDGGTVTWEITAADVEVAGRGRAELQYLDGDVCKKSAIYTTNTLRALNKAGKVPPEPEEGWVRQVLDAKTAAETAVSDAQKAAGNASAERVLAEKAANSAGRSYELASIAADRAEEAADRAAESVIQEYVNRVETAVTNAESAANQAEDEADRAEEAATRAEEATKDHQSDWAQNNSGTKDYVKNRPFYRTDSGDVVKLPNEYLDAEYIKESAWAGEDEVIGTATGETMDLNDSGGWRLRSLYLYGKTTQNGTPSPDNPVPLESVGADGTVGVTVAGKNLFDGILYGGYRSTIDGEAFGDTSLYKTMLFTAPTAGKYTFSFGTQVRLIRFDGVEVAENVTVKTYDLTAGRHYISLRNSANTAWDDSVKIQLEYGSIATDWEPYKTAQTLTAQTPNGLLGIKLGATIPDVIANSPAHMSGVYWDEKTQAYWLCDTIDGASGKHVQRVGFSTFNNPDDWSMSGLSQGNYYHASRKLVGVAVKSQPILCNMYPFTGTFSAAYNCHIYIASDGLLYVIDSDFTTHEEWRSFVADNNLMVAYPLATPIETDLSAEELAQYAALRTNYPNTTVFNDSGAGMGVSYVVGNKFEQMLTEMIPALEEEFKEEEITVAQIRAICT